MLTAVRIPVAVHSSGFMFQCRYHVKRLTTEEGVNDVHTNAPSLDRGCHRTSESEHSVFAGGVHRGTRNTTPGRLKVGV